MANIITQSGPLSSTGVLWQANVDQYDGVQLHVTDSGGGSTIIAEYSDDNSTWSQVGTVNTTGRFFYAADNKYFRFRVSTFVSGAVRVGVELTTVSPKSLVVSNSSASSSVVSRGSSSGRPVLTNSQSGVYFDTDLGKPIFWTGTKWVSATGADLVTNLIVDGTSLGTASWTRTSIDPTGNTLVAGSSTLQEIQSTAAGGQFAQTETVVSGTSYTMRARAKAGSSSTLTLIFFYNGGASYQSVAFNLAAGTVGTPDGVGTAFSTPVAAITAGPNGTYDCSITSTISVSDSIETWFRIPTGTAYLGDLHLDFFP